VEFLVGLAHSTDTITNTVSLVHVSKYRDTLKIFFQMLDESLSLGCGFVIFSLPIDLGFLLGMGVGFDMV
jgi:hypothetical protein